VRPNPVIDVHTHVAHVRLAGLDAMVQAGVLGGNARRFLGT